MSPIEVVGTALWTLGYDSVAAWLAGTPDPGVTSPAAAVAGSRVKRGTSLLTRMQIEVVAEAGRAAGLDLATVATVFGSAGGETRIALMQMDMMREGDGIVSPARFKNSVHNTGSGVFCIATGNRGFTTAIAAGRATLAAVLLEAFALLADGHDDVIAVVADEPLPPPLDRFGRYDPLAIAFALRLPKPADGKGLSTLTDLNTGPTVPPGASVFEPPPALRHNPVMPALSLLRAVHDGPPGPVVLTAGDGPGAHVIVTPLS